MSIVDHGPRARGAKAGSSSTALARPLAGTTVVDFSVGVAGPWACGILADQGASVIKVERIGVGGAGRFGATVSNGVSSVFHMANRGKRSITLNLADPEGVKIALELCRTASVVVQNYRPGVADRLGIGYDDICALNAEVVYVSITGLGQEGPHSHVRVYDTVIQARAGIADIQRAEGELDAPPALVRHALADKITALAVAQAATAALLARSRGHGGQRIDISMLDVAVAFMWLDSAGTHTLPDAPPGQSGSVTFGLDCYPFADGWAVICPVTATEVLATMDAFGVPVPDTFDIDDKAARERHRNELAKLMVAGIRAIAPTLKLAEAQALAEDRQVPFDVVRGLEDTPTDPQLVASDLFVESRHEHGGRVLETRQPIRFGGRRAADPPTSPILGEHTSEILEGIGVVDVEALRARGVVG